MAEPILIIDDEEDARNLLSKVLRKEGYETTAVSNGEAALEEARRRRYAAVLSDYNLPGMNGLEVLEKLLLDDPEVQVLMVTAHGTIRLAVEAVKKGAYHFIEKPFDLDELRIAVKNAVHNYDMVRENSRLKGLVEDGDPPQPYILGANPAMKAIWKIIDRVADSKTTVLVEGESGTGKEVVAKALHQKSGRRNAAFVALNCAALTRELIESELFGHVRGAFTGAVETKKGHFEAADGGTLFLDEVGELPLDLQGKLLRVLQEGTFERVGDVKSRAVDVRVLAATNRNLAAAVKEKSFREDLYYRLNVVNVKLPPLRERREDIPALIEFFAARFAVRRGLKSLRIAPDANQFLREFDYPGNIRELANMLERATVLCVNETIQLRDLVPALGQAPKPPAAKQTELLLPETTNFAEAKAQFEAAHLARLLAQAHGNVSLAARLAGMDRNNFKDKMRKHGIQSEDFRE